MSTSRPTPTTESAALEEKYNLIEMRRAKLLRLLASGMNQTEAAEALGVHKSTITIDLQVMRKEAKEGIMEYIEETLPFEHKKTIAAFDEIIKQAWTIAAHYKDDPRVMLQSLNTISDAVMKRQQVLGDPQYIEKAIKSVAGIKKSLDSQSQKKKEEEPKQPEQPVAKSPEPQAMQEDDPVIGIEIKEEASEA
jgi:hypothetical protein